MQVFVSVAVMIWGAKGALQGWETRRPGNFKLHIQNETRKDLNLETKIQNIFS